MTANITAMGTQVDAVLNFPAGATALQETRLTRAGQKKYCDELAQKGWTLVCGAPLLEKRTEWEASAGGVAIVAAPGVPLQQPPPLNSMEQELLDTTRYVRALLPYGDGRAVLHIINVYGFSGSVGS